MNLLARIIGGLLCLLLLQGCASTSISDYTDPSYVDVTFYSVAIWAKSDDLEWRQDLETKMQQRVQSHTGASAIRVIDVAPPTRGFSVAEIYQLLQGANVDAAIVIVFTDKGVRQSVSSDGYGNVSTSDEPWGEATVEVVDIKSSMVAWTASTSTQGDDFTGWDDIRRSAGNRIISQLLSIGMLPPVPEGEAKK